MNLEPGAARIRDRLDRPDESLHAPHLLDLEVLQTLRRQVLSGLVSEDRSHRAVAALSDMRIVRYSHAPLIGRIWELRENLTAYDAAYVALAEALKAPLVTRDTRLAQAPGNRATVELYQ